MATPFSRTRACQIRKFFTLLPQQKNGTKRTCGKSYLLKLSFEGCYDKKVSQWVLTYRQTRPLATA
jgi:hypothetical protein